MLWEFWKLWDSWKWHHLLGPHSPSMHCGMVLVCFPITYGASASFLPLVFSVNHFLVQMSLSFCYSILLPFNFCFFSLLHLMVLSDAFYYCFIAHSSYSDKDLCIMSLFHGNLLFWIHWLHWHLHWWSHIWL